MKLFFEPTHFLSEQEALEHVSDGRFYMLRCLHWLNIK